MLPVSEEFLEQIVAGRRNPRAKIEITWTDTQEDETIRASADAARGSYPEQVVDNIDSPTEKWFSLDGQSMLNGEYYVAPNEDNKDLYQVGWWGTKLADENGDFASTQLLRVAFPSRPVIELKVFGDSLREEYPVDFDVEVYDDEQNLIYTEEVRGNTDIFWRKDVVGEGLSNVTRLELKIYKWSHSNKQCKIIEFFSSIRQVYTDDDIMFLNLIEESEVEDAGLPIGNISTNEVSFRLYNENNRFSPGNPDSALFGLVKKNRRVQPFVGIEIDDFVEWQPLGTFWTGDWSAPEQELYAETTARDRLELMRESTFETSEVIEDTNLYELAEIVFQDYGLTPDRYNIDAKLMEFEIKYGWFDPISHREALRQIAEASVSRVYSDRRGIIRIESEA